VPFRFLSDGAVKKGRLTSQPGEQNATIVVTNASTNIPMAKLPAQRRRSIATSYGPEKHKVEFRFKKSLSLFQKKSFFVIKKIIRKH